MSVRPIGDRLESWQTRIIWANMLGLVFEAFDLTVYALLIVPVSQYFHVPTWYGFLVLTLTYVLRAAGGLVFGSFADKVGRRTMLIVTVLGYSVFTALTGLSWSIGTLVFFRAVTGFFVGGEYISGSYSLESVPSRLRGLISSFVEVSYVVGFFLAALAFGVVAGLLHSPNSWRYVFYVGIVPALIALWLRIGIEESPMWRSVEKKVKRSAPLAAIFKRPYLGTTMSLWIYMGGMVWGYGSLILAYPTYLHYLKLPVGEITLLTALVNVGGAIGSLVFGPLSQRIGRRWALILGDALAVVVSFLFAPYWMGAVPSLGYMIPVAILQGAFCSSGYAVVFAWLSERYPTEVRATGSTGTYNGGQLIGGWATTIMAALVGVAVTAHSWAVAMVVSALCGYAVSIVFALFGPETKHVDLATMQAPAVAGD